MRREKHLLIDFLCASAGGPLLQTFIGHVEATLDGFKVPAGERAEVLAFVDSTKSDIVE